MNRILAILPAVALLAGSPARAHAVLMSSVPAPGGSMPAGAQTLTLRYNSLVDAGRSRLALVGADGTETRLAVTAGATGDVMQARAVLAPGPATLRWQVLAIDGHITRGGVAFAVTAPQAAPGAVPGR